MRTEAATLAVWFCCTTGCEESRPPAPPTSSVVPAVATPPADAGTSSVDAGAPQPASETPAVQVLSALVFSLGGQTEVKRAGHEDWGQLRIGDPIHVGDEVRTSTDGNVVLSFGDPRVKLEPGSEMTLKILEPRRIRATVRGRADAVAGQSELVLEGDGSDAVASSTGGRLWLSSDGRGTASISAVEGSASVVSGGKTVPLSDGEFVAVRAGGKMTRPAHIPKRVSVKVNWPHESETNKAILSIAGRASIFAQVSVQGRHVDVSPEGDFVAQVPLKRGSQVIKLAVIDPLGRRAVETRRITFDPDAPDIKGQVKYR
jgi:hypothetical protein